jgi:hypothetical protein
MTVTINAAQFDFYINTPNVPLGEVSFDIMSQLSNTVLATTIASVTDSNDRYTTLSVFLEDWDIPSKHYNGIYEYTVYSNENIYDTGLLKIVTEPGGTTGTIDYQSNNEDRQAKVIYRPAYE